MPNDTKSWPRDDSAGLTRSIQQQLDGKPPRPIRSEGGVNDRHCVLCKEEGKANETARDMVTIRKRSGGEPRRVAACSAHVKSLGEPTSPYVVAEPIRGLPTRGSARPRPYVEGKKKDGDISRTIRRVERYGRTQRGRLGE